MLCGAEPGRLSFPRGGTFPLARSRSGPGQIAHTVGRGLAFERLEAPVLTVLVLGGIRIGLSITGCTTRPLVRLMGRGLAAGRSGGRDLAGLSDQLQVLQGVGPGV